MPDDLDFLQKQGHLIQKTKILGDPQVKRILETSWVIEEKTTVEFVMFE